MDLDKHLIMKIPHLKSIINKTFIFLTINFRFRVVTKKFDLGNILRDSLE